MEILLKQEKFKERLIMAYTGMQYGSSRSSASNVSGLVAQFQAAAARARAANIAREREVRALHDQIISRAAQPSTAGMKEIEAAGVKAAGTGMQQLISSGLYGTTTAAALSRQWEAEVGAPARLKLEDIAEQRLSSAQQAKAGFVERIQEPYPDYGPLMQAIQAATSVGGAGGAPSKGPYIEDGGGFGTYGAAPSPTYGYGGFGTTQAPTRAATPTRARTMQPTAGTTGAAMKPTVAEQHVITQRLKAQYPQMYKPGWGKATTSAKKPKTSLWSSISSAVLGRPF